MRVFSCRSNGGTLEPMSKDFAEAAAGGVCAVGVTVFTAKPVCQSRML